MFSKSCEYGIRAVLHIAHTSQQEKRVGLKIIAKEIDAPEAFTAKIMQQLSRAKIVSSIKGPNGGFEMSEKLRKSMHIMDIVKVLDGNGLYENCGLGLNKCHDGNPCPLHDQYKKIRNNLVKMHSDYSIEKLAKTLSGKASLK